MQIINFQISEKPESLLEFVISRFFFFLHFFEDFLRVVMMNEFIIMHYSISINKDWSLTSKFTLSNHQDQQCH